MTKYTVRIQVLDGVVQKIFHLLAGDIRSVKTAIDECGNYVGALIFYYCDDSIE